METKGKQIPLVVHAASEVVGFSKTGGLADVAGALPRALSRRGFPCAIVTPLYRSIRSGKTPITRTGHTFTVPIGTRLVSGAFWQAQLRDSDVPVYLVEQPQYFERDNPGEGRGLYHFTLSDGQRRDYPDNCERFVFFCRAILESLHLLSQRPLIVHHHDWQTGLVSVYLHEVYRRFPTAAVMDRVRSIFTIHNMAYQGVYPAESMTLAGLDWRLFNFRQLEFYGQFNFLKAGVVFADLLTTVSPTYAKEIQTPYFGWGLEGALGERNDRLFGIVNGVDYEVWNPASDRLLAANYDQSSFLCGKALCKTDLQERFGLPRKPSAPLLGMIARLVDQKGLGLFGPALEPLLQEDIQVIVLGEGDQHHHQMLLDLQGRHPQKVGLALTFDDGLAHRIEAGADVFLMPSTYEPSGLNQLYSLKYGTVPVVRATGGLADTIVDCTSETLKDGRATGFTFIAQVPAAFSEAIRRALNLYRNNPEHWQRLVRNGMCQDWSWDRSAGEYEALYLKAFQLE